MFLSADLAAFEDTERLGIDHDSNPAFCRTAEGNDRAWAAASARIRERRSGIADRIVFTDEDRKAGE